MDIRQLLEQLSKLSREPLQEQAQSNVRQLPLKVAPKGKIDPGTQAMNQMGVVLTKPGETPAEPAATAPKPAQPVPGQKNLFALPKLEPETPALLPKQPWLDPKGSKEPAFMRKAAGTAPAEPLGMIGGTGPDAKFAKAAAANEPVKLPKAPATNVKNIQPRVKIGPGSEYTNVYSTAKGVDNKPSFADVQYAKDVQRELEKTPNDPNLKAELGLLQQRGIAPKPAAQPATQPEPEQSSPNGNPKSATVPPVGTGEPKKIEPTAVSYDPDAWMRQHGVVKEYADEFENHINNLFNEQGIPGLIRRLFTKGKPKAPEAPPTVTPQKPVQMPKDVETPAYVRKAEKGAAPEPSKPTQAANDPKMPPQKGDKTDIGNVVPGPKPIEPPKAEPTIPKPMPGKPGSVTKQRRKLIPPVLPADAPGGGKTTPEPEPVKPLPVDVDSDDSQLQVPSKVDLPTLQGPLPPNSPFVVSGPETSGSKTDKPEAPAAAEKPTERPPVRTEPLTKQQLDIINQNDREAAKAKAEKERQQAEPVKPAEPGAGTAPAKPSSPATGSGTGTGTGSGSGTGPGTGTKPAKITPGYDPDAWMQQHGVVKESRAIRHLLKDFKKFVNKPRA